MAQQFERQNYFRVGKILAINSITRRRDRVRKSPFTRLKGHAIAEQKPTMGAAAYELTRSARR